MIETTTDEDNSSEDDEADTTSISSVHVSFDMLIFKFRKFNMRYIYALRP